MCQHPLPTRAAHTKQIVRQDETSKQHFYYSLIYFFYSHYSIYLIICICTRFLWYAFNQFNLLYHLALLQRCCIYYVPRSYAISLRIFDQYEIFLQYNYSLFLKQHSEEINFTYITNKSILYRTIYVILLVIYYSIH